jgi:23S rRNA (adenine2030-N6)-methyltransferase
LNYRHDFHAGNFADVVKHIVLVMMLERMLEKPQPFCVLDVHAGAGLYDLRSDAAMRSGEFRHGVLRLLDRQDAPPDVAAYLALLHRFNPSGGMDIYPGSPAIAREMLRADDRLVLNELEPSTLRALRSSLGGDRRVAIHSRDAYEAMGALLPPEPRRVLLLVDPPFEQNDEFERMAAALVAAWRRWPTGRYLVWYPVKTKGAAGSLIERLRSTGADGFALDFNVGPADESGGLAACGLAVLNPPWRLDAGLEACLPWLTSILARGRGASWSLVQF